MYQPPGRDNAKFFFRFPHPQMVVSKVESNLPWFAWRGIRETHSWVLLLKIELGYHRFQAGKWLGFGAIEIGTAHSAKHQTSGSTQASM